jgi:hypothetical protein
MVLLRKDFQELIDFCQTRRMGYTILDKVDEWVAYYDRHNPRCLLQLMEEIEIQYPELTEAFGFDTSLHEIEVMDFSELDVDIKEKQVAYLYSYILSKNGQELFHANSQSDDAGDQSGLHNNMAPDQRVALTEQSKSTELGSIKTLRCILSKTLPQLHAYMIENNIIAEMAVEDFVFLFSNQSAENSSVRIVWKLKHHEKQYNYRAIHQLLITICREEFSLIGDYFKKVQRFFLKADGTSLANSAIRSLYKKNKDEEAATKFDLSTVSKRAKPFLEFVKHLVDEEKSKGE